MKIAGILLAAGASTRFGTNKLQDKLIEEIPMAVATARNLLSAVSYSMAVLRPGHDELARWLGQEGLPSITCGESKQGMSASLRCGISATFDAEGWVVMLADMPFIKPTSISYVLEALQEGALLAAPEYKGTRGHPVGFSNTLRKELLQLCGDSGARKLLERYASQLKRIAVNDPGILIDIDTPVGN
jgi:molybdenum cofactor cytidylyltransferase